MGSGEAEQVELDEIERAVDVEAEPFEVRGDHIADPAVRVLVAERLGFGFVEIGGPRVFQFDDRADRAVAEERAVGRFGVLDVFQFAGQIVVFGGRRSVAEDLAEKFRQELPLELLLGLRADIRLDRGIEKKGGVGLPRRFGRGMFGGLFTDYGVLKQRHRKIPPNQT